MVIFHKEIKWGGVFFLALYYSIARWLPASGKCFNIGKVFRRYCCKHIFKRCGKNVNIERGAWFASGLDIEIGDFSGIGINAHIPNGTIIGDYVMMGPNVFILDVNHNFEDKDNPMMFQGMTKKKITHIGNDCWIGRDVFMTPGRTIADHSIVAARCVLTKDFPEYSVIGGNPSRLLKTRK